MYIYTKNILNEIPFVFNKYGPTRIEPRSSSFASILYAMLGKIGSAGIIVKKALKYQIKTVFFKIIIEL